ncbi:TetR/AcrR family transcriptional regulator [Pseudomonas schmalbachii]|uniref:TetR/AcrR family transcriptional regulator n=1 Tax=Pseudomonas schmalbachii TaxID=2816993 RepID=A0ABS3TJX9_9PSED|nr:TetR/AcrR family transcriptional regulator [Pseudomonas schmalbachii]MBO3273948.1 TetR/AcrR family transcriptional regulator [Pseudomonas schmalbachii]
MTRRPQPPSGERETEETPRAATSDSLLQVTLPARQRKRPRQARSIALVDALKIAGREILEREGRAALSVYRLAEHAGVAISSIYEYFPTIESLVAAIFDDYRADGRREAIACIQSLPASATLMDGIETLLKSGLAQLHRWLQIDSELSVKTAYYAELVRLEMVKSEQSWAAQVLPVLVERFSSEVVVRDRELAGFLAFQAVLALPRALVIDRPEYLLSPQTVRLLSRMIHAVLTAEDSEGSATASGK